MLAALLLPLLCLAGTDRADELLAEIRARGNAAPGALFAQLGALGTPAALEALEKATASVTGLQKVHTAQLAFRAFADDEELARGAAEFLSRRADHADRRIALHAVWIAGDLGPPAAEALSALALGADDADARALATMRLAEPGMEVGDSVLRRLRRDEDETVRYLALLAGAERQPSETRAERCAALARARDPLERLVATELARSAAPPEVDALARALGDEDPRVRRAAVAALGGSRDTRAVLPLIDALEIDDEATRRVVAAELARLTGRALGSRPGPWRRWWRAEGASFVLPDGGAAPAAEAGAPADATRAGFFGLPLFSKRLVFVIDASDSMKKTVPGTDQTRLEVAKRELARAIEGLPEDALFDVVHFGRGAEVWQGELVEVSRRTRQRALDHVEAMGTSWGTDAYSALREALRDPRVEHLVLLTDGDPALGPINGKPALRRIFAGWNATRRASVDCVAVGQERKWLRELAAETGGRYVRVD